MIQVCDIIREVRVTRKITNVKSDTPPIKVLRSKYSTLKLLNSLNGFHCVDRLGPKCELRRLGFETYCERGNSKFYGKVQEGVRIQVVITFLIRKPRVMKSHPN